MKKIISKTISALLAACIACGGSASAVAETEPNSIANSQGTSNYLLLQDIIDLYLETSLYETDRETLINDMLRNYLAENPYMLAALANALLSSNDPYSAYYTSNIGFMESSSKSYGIVVVDSDSFDDDDPRKNSEGVYISEVIEGSNAEYAGILPGDRFVSLEGMNVEGLTLTGVKYLLNFLPLTQKLPEDSPIYSEFTGVEYDAEKFMEYTKLNWDPTKEVEMVFERTLSDGSKATVDIRLPKGVAENKDVYLSIDKETATATIELVAFDTEKVTDQFKEAFYAAKDAGCTNLIIDMRDNPGGYFEAAKTLGSLFTEGEQVMFYIRSRGYEEPQPVMSDGASYIGDAFDKYAVIVNANTASAAELFAYILRDKAGAVIIGEPSYGKAMGQQVYSVMNGDTFTITNFEILTADKSSYNTVGLIPDIEVPLVPEKYVFPEGLSHFNHTNYVEIVPGAQNDAVLALEQRMGIIGLMRDEAIDGIYDDSTGCAVLVYRKIIMGDKNVSTELTYDTVTRMTATINSYKNKYVYIDSQLDVANRLFKNKSQAKRLATEYKNAKKKYDDMIAAEEEAARLEYEEERRRERENEAAENVESDGANNVPSDEAA